LLAERSGGRLDDTREPLQADRRGWGRRRRSNAEGTDGSSEKRDKKGLVRTPEENVFRNEILIQIRKGMGDQE